MHRTQPRFKLRPLPNDTPNLALTDMIFDVIRNLSWAPALFSKSQFGKQIVLLQFYLLIIPIMSPQ